jgi:hypothetical protein
MPRNSVEENSRASRSTCAMRRDTSRNCSTPSRCASRGYCAWPSDEYQKVAMPSYLRLLWSSLRRRPQPKGRHDGQEAEGSPGVGGTSGWRSLRRSIRRSRPGCSSTRAPELTFGEVAHKLVGGCREVMSAHTEEAVEGVWPYKRRQTPRPTVRTCRSTTAPRPPGRTGPSPAWYGRGRPRWRP